jgi:hypothetical protein
MAEFVTIAKVVDIESGHGKTVILDGKKIAVFNVEGAFYAIADTCAHRSDSLGEGQLQGNVVVCPLSWSVPGIDGPMMLRWERLLPIRLLKLPPTNRRLRAERY